LTTGCAKLGGLSQIVNPPSPFNVISGVIKPSVSSYDFALPNSAGSYAVSEATLYADVSASTVYMKNASIGSLTLSSNILTPLKVRYAVGSATSTQMTESKAGVFTMSAASSTYPSQLALYQNGTVYSNDKLLNGTSTACISYTASTSFATLDMQYRVALGFPITINKVRCRVLSGTSINLGLTDGTNLMSSTTCATTQTISYPAANNTFVKDESIIFDIENNVGVSDAVLYYCFDYTRT